MIPSKMLSCMVVVCALLWTGANADSKTSAVSTTVRAVSLEDIEWSKGPLPGTQTALLAGDPEEGFHHVYLKFADDCYVPPHWHTSDEYLTVVSGEAVIGVGEKADRKKARSYGPGAFILIPAGVRHYGWSRGECVLSQTRTGPADMLWVNEADAPRKSGDR